MKNLFKLVALFLVLYLPEKALADLYVKNNMNGSKVIVEAIYPGSNPRYDSKETTTLKAGEYMRLRSGLLHFACDIYALSNNTLFKSVYPYAKCVRELKQAGEQGDWTVNLYTGIDPSFPDAANEKPEGTENSDVTIERTSPFY